MIIDTHCHMDDKQFDDLNEIMTYYSKNKILCISNGTDPKANKKVLELAKKYPQIKASLGFYPVDLLKADDQTIENELEFIKKNADKIVSIGEVGLDNYWEKDQLEKQIKWLKRFIELSIELQKPLQLHTRKAEPEVLEILKGYNKKDIIFHCFGGNLKIINQIIEKGWYFSIPATVVYDEHFQRLVELCPLNKLLTETDAPLLSPIKGERNDARNIKLSIKKIAEIKKMDEKEIENILYINARELFDI